MVRTPTVNSDKHYGEKKGKENKQRYALLSRRRPAAYPDRGPRDGPLWAVQFRDGPKLGVTETTSKFCGHNHLPKISFS